MNKKYIIVLFRIFYIHIPNFNYNFIKRQMILARFIFEIQEK